MSVDQSTNVPKAVEIITDDMTQEWIHQVEHEETIVAAEVDEHEVEEFIEVDGIVDEHDIGRNIQSHPNEVIVSSELRNGSEMCFDDTTVGEQLSINLPNLLSRVVNFTNGSKVYLCFSKRCRKQICFEGHLYNIDGFVKPTNWNLWRCANPSCNGAIRTPPNITELRVREPHSFSCLPDDIQIRLRITIYDLRLMAEFTDLPLDSLYHAYLHKVMDEHTDIVHLFPSFDTLKANLEEHRSNLIYRRRFAAEARECDTHSMYSDSFGITANSAKFKRTKPFPPSLCMRCNAEFRSMPEIPSQDQLLEHIFFDHNRKSAVVNRFTFDDPGLFEQWIRELQYHSRFRLKKMCLHDEHMYYLCQNDVRHFKSIHSRSTIPDMHCTAFVRVHDWRFIIQGEINEVVVDYCLDHFFHNDESNSPVPPYKSADLFTPEVFIRDLAVRRERTQQLIQDKGLQRIKRRGQPPSIFMHGSMQKPRKVDTIPLLKHDVAFGDCNGKKDSLDYVFGASQSEQRQTELPKPPYITKRENFADLATYVSVLQIEISCNMIKERMQYARSNRTASHYLARLTRIVDDVMADPLCAPLNVVQRASKVIKHSVENVCHPLKIPRLLSSSPSAASQAVNSSEVSSVSREAKTEPDDSLPVCQKELVRKGDNGELVVLRRTIPGKVRKITGNKETASKDDSLQEVRNSSKKNLLVNQNCEAVMNNKLTEMRSSPNHGNKDCGDLLPITELLSETTSRATRYDQTSLRGVRRIAYESMAQQNNAYFEDARRFVQMFSEHPISNLKSDKGNAIRRSRGRPRKYP